MQNKKKQYYLEQFKKIEENKLSWNWAAFCFGPFWFAYRKIYSGFWKSLLSLAALGGMALFLLTPFINEGVCFGLWFISWFIFNGFQGNRWYYSTVKHRFIHGYHLLENYKTTSAFLVDFFLLSSVIDIALNARCFEFFGYILIVIYWYNDKRKAKKIAKDKTFLIAEMKEEDILKLI